MHNPRFQRWGRLFMLAMIVSMIASGFYSYMGLATVFTQEGFFKATVVPALFIAVYVVFTLIVYKYVFHYFPTAPNQEERVVWFAPILMVLVLVSFSMSTYFSLIGIGSSQAKRSAIEYIFRDASRKLGQMIQQREREYQLIPDLKLSTQFFYRAYREEGRRGTFTGSRGGGRMTATFYQNYRIYRAAYKSLQRHRRRSQQHYGQLKRVIRQIRTLYHDKSYPTQEKAERATPHIVRLNRLFKQLNHSSLPLVQGALESTNSLNQVLRVDDGEIHFQRNRRRRAFLARQQMAQAKFYRAHNNIKERLKTRISELTQHRRIHTTDYRIPTDLLGVFEYLGSVWPLFCAALVIDLMPLIFLWFLTHLHMRQTYEDQQREEAETREPQRQRPVPTIPPVRPVAKPSRTKQQSHENSDNKEKTNAKRHQQASVPAELDALPPWMQRVNARKAHQTGGDPSRPSHLHQ